MEFPLFLGFMQIYLFIFSSYKLAAQSVGKTKTDYGFG